MQLHTLGTLRLEGARFTQPKPLLLLSYLSLEGAKSKRHLAELFWPEGNRMKSLSMTLTRLRQGAGEVVGADAGKVWANLPSDAKTLLERLEQGDRQHAVEQYTGAFLEGVVLDDWSAELEEWVYNTREYLAERVQHALLGVAEVAARAGDFAGASVLAEKAYRLPGLGGQDVEALNRLYPLLCAGDSALASAVRREAESYDLGFGLELSRDAARATFAGAAPKVPNPELPVRRTSFVGRDVELTELATLLRQPEVSLVTLVGVGGAGKTRLALQLAHQEGASDTFGGGVYFVALDALKDAASIFPSLLSHFGLTPRAELSPPAQVSDFLAERRALLILDNVEQLTGVGALLSQLLSGCPKLKLLVTSRERLRIEEEQVFLLGGLSYPSAVSEAAAVSEAVRLFGARAQQVEPRFALAQNLAEVVRLCQLVEGVPLALELAASWVRLMPCAEIAAEIAGEIAGEPAGETETPELLSSSSLNIPERHRSLKAVFEGSWARLTDRERAVLRKLSVFRGGFRRDAAAHVAGASIPVLAALVDKSLLKVLPEGRYGQHPLLYRFTQAKLAERPAEQLELRRAHASFYLELAERAEPLLQSKAQILWFGRLGEELDNFRAALDFLGQTDPAAALTLAAALGTFWQTKGYYREGYGYLEKLLQKTQGSGLRLSAVRTKATLRAAHLVRVQGDHERAEGLFIESLAAAEMLGDTSLKVEALAGLGLIALLNHGDYALARSRFEAGLELAREAHDKALTAYLLRLLGALSNDRAEYRQAKIFYEDAAALSAELDDPHNEAKSLMNLATPLTCLGDEGRAHTLNEASLEKFRAVGDRHGEGIALLNLGLDASNSGDKRTGIKLYEESLALFRELGDKQLVSHLLNNLAGDYQTLGEPNRARGLLDESLALQRRTGNVSLIAHALYLLGQVCNDLGEKEQGLGHYTACAELCRKNGENWTLMRVLEVSAKWHLEQRNFAAAGTAVEEALGLARSAGDKKVLEQALATRRRLEETAAT